LLLINKSKESKSKESQIDEVDDEDADLDYDQPKTNEDKAKYLFNKAVMLEQQGRHFDGKFEGFFS
jgi:hypothetical protein